MYRVFIDIEAKDKNNAIKEVAMALEDNTLSDLCRVQEDPFDDEEEGIILELARMSLADAEVYDEFAERLDLSDKELKRLQKKIEKITNNKE